MSRMGINIHVEDPPQVVEGCFKECDPTAQQLMVLSRALNGNGDLSRAIIEGATSVKLTSRCAGKLAGRCAMQSICTASVGETVLASQEYSASELGT